MSLNDQFDELARRKLEERAFPFDEGAWQSAQSRIAADRKRRKGAWYLLGLIPLAFIAWLLWPGHDRSTGNSAALADDAGAAMTGAAMEVRKAPDATTLPERSAASIREVAQPDARSEQATPQPATAPETSAGTAAAASRAMRKNRMIITPSNRAPASTALVIADPDAAEHPEAGSPPAQWTASAQAAAHAAEAATGPRTITSSAQATDQIAGSDPQSSGESDALEPSAQDKDAPYPQTQASEFEEAHPEPDPPTVAEAAAPPPVIGDAPSLPTSAPADSAADAVQAPPPPPLIAARSPWELSVLGGLQRTSSRYASDRLSGIASAPGQSPAFGAELVRMGRNVGFGIGLHHAAYNDRLNLPEQRSMAWEVTRRWFLQSVDTTILFITGTDTVGGQVVHTGFNVSTTVQVLASTYDTTAIARIRAARAFSVRTSYLELPLLLDGHLVQGRWSLGIRGGPSLGLLTARNGSIPSESGEADAPLRDAAVRQWMVGWTARAYARYRFNAAWSVGVEPMARGQLIDAIDGPVLTRRSTAIGALLSLSCRLR